MDAKDIDFYSLGFEFIETKIMYISDFKNGEWDQGKLVPFGDIHLSPAACVLNYGQEIFEGMKALLTSKGDITLFRPQENAKRFNNSAERILMPKFDENRFIEAIKQVVRANKDYIPPYDSGGALYIRPLMIGSGPILGVKPAKEYKVIIFTVPVGPYFPQGFTGIDLEITKEFTRAAPGGTGYAKTGCNYAGSMMAAKLTKEKGFSQVIYLDAIHKEFIEEVGTANFFAIINGELLTPTTSGTILPGITRISVLELASKKLGITSKEKDISYKEIFKDSCSEVFCTGTAAVITPIKSVSLDEKQKVFSGGEPGPYTRKLYELLTRIQRLDIKDEFNWVVKV
ncbi:MAG: branched-chain amino acid aminotransferase [Candidatus Thorarchaeota archaeon]